MKFIFENNRTPVETKTLASALNSQWMVSDVFKDNLPSSYLDEETRLRWAPVLASLAFGEGTAFYGFGGRIAEAEDLSAKSWLSVHLLDEARHTEGFSELLAYLYPSHHGRLEDLFQSRDVLVFYGHTHRCVDLTQWLLCTQIAETYGRQCYRALHQALAADPVVQEFFGHILTDENRHISYIGSLIRSRFARMDDEKKNSYEPFIHKMSALARNMFEARKRGVNYRSFEAMDIDVSAFCERAQDEIVSKFAEPVC